MTTTGNSEKGKLGEQTVKGARLVLDIGRLESQCKILDNELSVELKMISPEDASERAGEIDALWRKFEEQYSCVRSPASPLCTAKDQGYDE